MRSVSVASRVMLRVLALSAIMIAPVGALATGNAAGFDMQKQGRITASSSLFGTSR